MLTHLQRPSTRRYSTAMPDTGGEGGQPYRLAHVANAAFAVAFLLSAVLVGLATVALH
ncbi:hypothetical protein Acsp01_13540 [Actinoplanes sp. NBRC 101535]|nr:hypothetical protein Acsp01_13540 [Actinoplanes sp. NBRC 101535]